MNENDHIGGNSISLKEYVDRRLIDRDAAVAAALNSAEKAVEKAERSAEVWRINANEWRGAMNDRERAFLTRKEFYAMVGTAAVVIGIVLAFKQ